MINGYDWYSGTAPPTTTKKDCRNLSGIATLCGAKNPEAECKYFKKSKNRSKGYGAATCMYDKFDCVCDKVVVDGKEIN